MKIIIMINMMMMMMTDSGSSLVPPPKEVNGGFLISIMMINVTFDMITMTMCQWSARCRRSVAGLERYVARMMYCLNVTLPGGWSCRDQPRDSGLDPGQRGQDSRPQEREGEAGRVHEQARRLEEEEEEGDGQAAGEALENSVKAEEPAGDDQEKVQHSQS